VAKEEVINALVRLDWGSFHECGHPVQRWVGKPLPCAECYRYGPRLRLQAPPRPRAFLEDPISSYPVFEEVLFDRAEFRVLPEQNDGWTEEVRGVLWRALKTVER
jgi:hypothetical protein